MGRVLPGIENSVMDREDAGERVSGALFAGLLPSLGYKVWGKQRCWLLNQSLRTFRRFAGLRGPFQGLRRAETLMSWLFSKP